MVEEIEEEDLDADPLEELDNDDDDDNDGWFDEIDDGDEDCPESEP